VGGSVEALKAYRAMHQDSLRDIEGFWGKLGRELLHWSRPFTRVLDWQPPTAHWFPDGELNASNNCLDRHLDGPTRDRIAYLWEGEDGAKRTLTYEEVQRQVALLAGALRDAGYRSGDVAAIYLPMVPELPIAMLALARIGVTFTAVFSGFSAEALASRMRDAGASLLITADGGYRRGRVVPLKRIADTALPSVPAVRRVLVVRRTAEAVPMTPGRDIDWETFLKTASSPAGPVAVPSEHRLYLLYSSGTTGVPKAIAHGTGGYLTYVAATMRWVFDPKPEDVYWCAADIGWVTGHSYIVFAPLLLGTSSLLYEGAFDFPAPDRFFSMVERYRVSILYTSPTALRGLRKAGDSHAQAHDLQSLRLLGTVGEAINPEVWRWYFDRVGGGRCPIVDTWWQTETGGIMISGARGLADVPMKPGSAGLPLPGIDAEVVDDHGRPAPAGTKGYAIIRRPWPGMLLGLHGDPERYALTYWTRFPGVYYPGDYAARDSEGYFWFLGRADEVLKVAGHRLGTIEIEDALLGAPGVAEAAVVGQQDELKGEVPVAFVTLRHGTEPSGALEGALADRVAEVIGKIARPERVHFVRALPKTRSGKIMRRVVKAVADGRTEVGDVSTLEEEASVDEIRAAIRHLREDI
jgi:acetyl-CoA synthetase